jgi:glutathione S-transferase
MAIVLHHVSGSRSVRVRWLLEELGLDYELERYSLTDGSLKTPEYREKSPLGKVPALHDGDLRLHESGAIVTYLLETYGEGRLEPAAGSPDRPLFHQWMWFSEATLMPPLGEIIANSFLLPKADRSEAALRNAKTRLGRALKLLEREIAGDYLLASGFSAADIMTCMALQLAKNLGQLPEDVPGVAAYLERAAARPAFQKAFAD